MGLAKTISIVETKEKKTKSSFLLGIPQKQQIIGEKSQLNKNEFPIVNLFIIGSLNK